MLENVHVVTQALSSKVKGDRDTAVKGLPGGLAEVPILQVMMINLTQFIQVSMSHFSFHRLFGNLFLSLLLFQH